MKLSVLCPAIRTERWLGLYDSIDKSFSGEWELILISSKTMPHQLISKKNIKLIDSRRSPMSKQQIGLCHAKGEWITVVSDDSVFLGGTLDNVFDNLPEKDVIVMKYLEGEEFDFPKWYHDQVPEHRKFKTNWDFMKDDLYYYTSTHDSSKMKGISPKSAILSVALIKRKLLLEVGGWDCQLQSQAMGNIDLAARFSNMDIKFAIYDCVVSKCGYMKQDTGDHSAIHYAQLEDDQPLLDGWYEEQSQRAIIDLYNWKQSDKIWKRGKDVN